mmetsp:Transcript_75401/g.196562  ORF Transcript_75401/g.196562 Transcript_75401/m.196562 type:complete len:304 (-) Transcript_75401:330-1241(-)
MSHILAFASPCVMTGRRRTPPHTSSPALRALQERRWRLRQACGDGSPASADRSSPRGPFEHLYLCRCLFSERKRRRGGQHNPSSSSSCSGAARESGHPTWASREAPSSIHGGPSAHGDPLRHRGLLTSSGLLNPATVLLQAVASTANETPPGIKLRGVVAVLPGERGHRGVRPRGSGWVVVDRAAADVVRGRRLQVPGVHALVPDFLAASHRGDSVGERAPREVRALRIARAHVQLLVEQAGPGRVRALRDSLTVASDVKAAAYGHFVPHLQRAAEVLRWAARHGRSTVRMGAVGQELTGLVA